jgi:hypothetical protein
MLSQTCEYNPFDVNKLFQSLESPQGYPVYQLTGYPVLKINYLTGLLGNSQTGKLGIATC